MKSGKSLQSFKSVLEFEKKGKRQICKSVTIANGAIVRKKEME